MNQVESQEAGKPYGEIHIPKNIFVLCTGRCGSVTFSKAAQHITNYTVGHESRAKKLAGDRLKYPEYHIEVDNRLSWFLNRLGNLYPDALYVWLRRNTHGTSLSFTKRFGNGGILDWWWKGVHMHPKSELIDGYEISQIARDYVKTVNLNIQEFINTKNHFVCSLETAKIDWTSLWKFAYFEGDFEKSLLEWEKKYNSSK